MGTTSFVLGVCAVIVLLMIVGTSINYIAIQTLKKDLEDYITSTENVFRDIYKDQENIRDLIGKVEQNVVRHTDSRVDKLGAKIYKDFDTKRIQSRQY